ncbi:MAG TPA: tRNA (adenine-N1)-methyltransferase [Candidatus Thermoplasmatota archaeon]|nr:tRNA (adenine-N1)-methyltransferase [Candidatus Thermoplasmatota archaeon]
MPPIAPGDLVAFADNQGHRVLVRAGTPGKPDFQKIPHLGVLDLSRVAGVEWGSEFAHGGKSYRLIRPTTPDLLKGFARKAQIIMAKDASRILYECGVKPGDRIVEAGIGSAFLTAALAQAVAPTGRVYVTEIREDFAEWGLNNLRLAGLDKYVEVRLGDVTQGIPVTDADAVILDMPTPWEAVPHARAALRAGGAFCAYTPNVSQMEATYRALEEHGFQEIRCFELIEREWTVGERGSRPNMESLGFTAFLTFARKLD